MAGNDIYPNQEVQIYTWRDATLRELCVLLQDIIPGANETNSLLTFSLVFVDQNGNYGIRSVIDIFVYILIFIFICVIGTVHETWWQKFVYISNLQQLYKSLSFKYLLSLLDWPSFA